MASKMAMKLGNKYKFSEVQTQHWDQFADAAGLGKAPARKRIVALAKTLPTQARALQASAWRRLRVRHCEARSSLSVYVGKFSDDLLNH